MAPGFRPVVLGVAGGSGSGKSTVVREVCRILGERVSTVLHHDSYYRDLAHLPFPEREGVNFDHPDAFDTSLLVQHLQALKGGQPVQKPVYDYVESARTSRSASALDSPYRSTHALAYGTDSSTSTSSRSITTLALLV